MKTGEIMLMLLVLGMCTLPIYWLIRAGNSRKRKLFKELLKSAGLKKLTLAHEQWANKIIALDSAKLYYITLNDNEDVSTNEAINITDIIKVDVDKNGDSKTKSYTRISLAILVGGKREDVKHIVLYHSGEDDAMETGYFLELSKRWQKNIHDTLIKIKQVA